MFEGPAGSSLGGRLAGAVPGWAGLVIARRCGRPLAAPMGVAGSLMPVMPKYGHAVTTGIVGITPGGG